MKQDVQQTMQEMMNALMGRVPRGSGNGGVGGAGSGSGGSGSDGYSVAGNSTNVPMYGPDRLAFSQSTGMAGGHGNSGRSRNLASNQGAGSQVKPDQHRESEQSKLLPENIPAKYRDAVKRYFSDDSAESKESDQ
ncbi:hypothetical protein HW115_08130 [Verrucomicrobiaceae bacterium N1E253]|uniref:Uncharacterized protein n=1 Tax=Oceaniferula marina TaxID=2748318 RepID=A0A851GDT1_9BACT|nr:hypothetical protein [Oceaniferula marina]NWK55576.1 hypothetical protein [Oceaniferula marina]